MSARELEMHEVESLNDAELEYVARPHDVPLPSYDPAVYGPLYREFATEDSEIAEQGMSDYIAGLMAEDRG